MANQPSRLAKSKAVEAPDLVNGVAVATTIAVAKPELESWQAEEKARNVAGIEQSRKSSEVPSKPISFELVARKELPQSLVGGSLDGIAKPRVKVAQKVSGYVVDELEKLGVAGAKDAIVADIANSVVSGQLRKADYELQTYNNTQAYVALLGVEGAVEAVQPILFTPPTGEVLQKKNFKRTSLLERFTTIHKIPTPRGEARAAFFAEAAAALDTEISAASDKLVKLIEDHNGKPLSDKEKGRVRMATAVKIGELYDLKTDTAGEASYEKNVLQKIKDGKGLAHVFANRVGEKTLDDRRFQSLLRGVGYASKDGSQISEFVEKNPLEQVRGKEAPKSTKSNLVVAIEAAGLKPEAKSAALTLARALELHRPVPLPGLNRVAKALAAFPKVQEHLKSPETTKSLLLQAGYRASQAATALYGRRAYQEAVIATGVAKPAEVARLTTEAKAAYTKAIETVNKSTRGDKEANLEMYDNEYAQEAFVLDIVGKGLSKQRWNEPALKAVEQSSEAGHAALESIL